MKTITVNVTDTENNIDKVMSKTNTNGTENAQYSPYYQKWNNVKLSDGTDLNGNPTLNRWYSYTVDEAGIYTLKPVKMNARLYTSDTTINTANVQVLASVPGIDDNNRSYGEDNSVYITVELDKVDTTDNKKAITEVNDVFTGVQNVDLDISQNLVAGAEAQVYTCFDNNNYIIGAIVIGDATGSVANYAYILGSIKSEEKIGDTYYWEFDAVLNGEQQTLTLKSKYASYADDIVKGRMVELRFDSDGYVVRVDDPDPVYNYSVATNDNGKDTDEYNVYWITSASAKKVFDLFLQGRTLYLTEKHSDRGLASASGAKAIVIQVENNKKVTTTWDSIEEAYAHLNDLSDSAEGVQFDGTIGAALNANGSAAWIVFDATVANRSQSVTQPTTPAGGYTPASIDPATGELKLRYYKTPMQPVQIKSEIEKLLGAVDHIDYVNGYVYLANGDVYKYNPAQTEVFAVRLNGNESPLAYVDSGETWTVAGLPQGNYNVDASWHSSSYGYDISVASNGNITGQKGKTISSVNKDVNIFSAYKITFSSDVSGKITIYGTTTSKDLESENYYYISATCPMDLSADGTDKYMKFTETTAGNDPEDINNEKFIKTGEKLTYKYEASHDATINVVSGYLVKVDGKQVGVFAGDIVFGDNSAYNDNSIFASVNKAVEKSNGNVFPSDAKITTTNSIGGFKIASATASSLAKDGVIDIVQVVEINATSITVSYSEDIEVDGTTNKYVKVGTELNLKETSPGGTKNLLQVKYDGIGTETNLDGQAGASKVTVGSGTSAAGASAVYKVPADYGKIAFSLKDSEA